MGIMYTLTKEQTIALQQVWNQIGYDILSEGDVVTKDDVVEFVIDADRPYLLFPEVDWTGFKELSYSDKKQVAATAFQYDEYMG